MKMRKSVKGISPLIATVLLIAFVIAAAGILSNFVLPFTKERASEVTTKGSEDIKCSFANIFIKEAKWNNTDDKISLTVENVGREKLEDFKATIIYTNNTVASHLMAPTTAELQPGDIETFTNSTQVGPCNTIKEIVIRSDTCPVDAKDTVKRASISTCTD